MVAMAAWRMAFRWVFSYRFKFEALRTRLSHQPPTRAFFSLSIFLCCPPSSLFGFEDFLLQCCLSVLPHESGLIGSYPHERLVEEMCGVMWWRKVGGTDGWQSGRPEQEAVGVRHYDILLSNCVKSLNADINCSQNILWCLYLPCLRFQW